MVGTISLTRHSVAPCLTRYLTTRDVARNSEVCDVSLLSNICHKLVKIAHDTMKTKACLNIYAAGNNRQRAYPHDYNPLSPEQNNLCAQKLIDIRRASDLATRRSNIARHHFHVACEEIRIPIRFWGTSVCVGCSFLSFEDCATQMIFMTFLSVSLYCPALLYFLVRMVFEIVAYRVYCLFRLIRTASKNTSARSFPLDRFSMPLRFFFWLSMCPKYEYNTSPI